MKSAIHVARLTIHEVDVGNPTYFSDNTFCYSGEKRKQGILEKEEMLRGSALAGQNKESQLAHYRDMRAHKLFFG